MLGKTIFFSRDMPAACEYCEHGKVGSDPKMILCSKVGIVSPHYSCKKFTYNPLKRKPKRIQKLPTFSSSDFSL